MEKPVSLLVLGASYGSLFAIKSLAAGHRVRLVCLPAEAEAIERDGVRVRMPVKARGDLVEVHSRALPGGLRAGGAEQTDPAEHDLVVLAMQEPQYGVPAVRELLGRIARARLPCLSIMNMPPLPYLARIPAIPLDVVRGCYTDASVWDGLEPALMTLCSPDPQAFRPAGEALNVLQVRLATNFKAARFPSEAHTALLRRLEADIEAVRYGHEGERFELPVKLRVHESVFVPLAKWAMLIAGNYRCIQREGIRSIRDAVLGDATTARRVYDWVVRLCVALGAAQGDLVPFEKYAAAAQSLASPSSVARALEAGATDVERVDRLVQTIGQAIGMRLTELDETVALVDARLERNRAAA